MAGLLVAVALQLTVATSQIAEYYSFGDVGTVATTHEKAVKDFMAIVTNNICVDFQPFRVIVYEPSSMTDEEVADLIQNAAPSVSLSADRVRAPEEFCGGVCGTPPLLVLKVDSESRADPAKVQEHAVHEANHIFQMQNGAPNFKTEMGDDGEDWREKGPRWWLEGTATWLGDRVLRAYPNLYTQPNAQRRNFARTLVEHCASFKDTEEQRGLRLTNAIQASDEPWRKLFEPYEMIYNGVNLGMQSAYFPIAYEGGYCACEYMLSMMGLDTQSHVGMSRGIQVLVEVQAATKTKGSWETAFLDTFRDHFSSMQDFYEKFEAARGAEESYTYVAPIPPSGCDDLGCGNHAGTQATNSGLVDCPAKCSGITNRANGFTCGTNKVFKANSNTITGNTVAACCDDACSGVTCAAGSQHKTNASSIAGTDTASGGVCCDASPPPSGTADNAASSQLGTAVVSAVLMAFVWQRVA